MNKSFSRAVVDVAALKSLILRDLTNVFFECRDEVSGYIDEIIWSSIERPLYDALNLDGAGIYDIVDNVDALRDMQNDLIDEVCEAQGL